MAVEKQIKSLNVPAAEGGFSPPSLSSLCLHSLLSSLVCKKVCCASLASKRATKKKKKKVGGLVCDQRTAARSSL